MRTARIDFDQIKLNVASAKGQSEISDKILSLTLAILDELESSGMCGELLPFEEEFIEYVENEFPETDSEHYITADILYRVKCPYCDYTQIEKTREDANAALEYMKTNCDSKDKNGK